MTNESCGCVWGKMDEVPPAPHFVAVGHYTDSSQYARAGFDFWILPCELHGRYAEECENRGFDEGLCK